MTHNAALLLYCYQYTCFMKTHRQCYILTGCIGRIDCENGWSATWCSIKGNLGDLEGDCRRVSLQNVIRFYNLRGNRPTLWRGELNLHPRDAIESFSLEKVYGAESAADPRCSRWRGQQCHRWLLSISITGHILLRIGFQMHESAYHQR